MTKTLKKRLMTTLALGLVIALVAATCVRKEEEEAPEEPFVVLEGPFSPTQHTSMGGSIEVDSVDIPAGVTVTAINDLVIRSKGPVNIAGIIQGLTLDDHGAGITIISEGAIDVTGEILAGNGPGAEVAMAEDDRDIEEGGSTWCCLGRGLRRTGER